MPPLQRTRLRRELRKLDRRIVAARPLHIRDRMTITGTVDRGCRGSIEGLLDQRRELEIRAHVGTRTSDPSVGRASRGSIEAPL